MSDNASREFVDTNILVYALDSSATAKQTIARTLLTRLWNSGTGCLSVQVLQEFFVSITRKVRQPVSADEAAAHIRDYTAWRVFATTAEDILSAITLHKAAGISFWDALVVRAATQLGCEVLWTEDMNDGQLISGVRIRNPFVQHTQVPHVSQSEDQ